METPGGSRWATMSLTPTSCCCCCCWWFVESAGSSSTVGSEDIAKPPPVPAPWCTSAGEMARMSASAKRGSIIKRPPSGWYTSSGFQLKMATLVKMSSRGAGHAALAAIELVMARWN
uniref:Putative secreted protein n=1 Tax=Anopheles darlingi TaxID=43151 RepID=A0A2M4DM12_ANODA